VNTEVTRVKLKLFVPEKLINFFVKALLNLSFEIVFKQTSHVPMLLLDENNYQSKIRNLSKMDQVSIVFGITLLPVADDCEVQDEVIGEAGRPLGPALVRAYNDAVLPVDHVVPDPLAEERLNLQDVTLHF
jgi:hypothetical protein